MGDEIWEEEEAYESEPESEPESELVSYFDVEEFVRLASMLWQRDSKRTTAGAA